MNKLKVAVIGNCQARPITGLLSTMCPTLDLLEPIIVHLSSADTIEHELAILSEADLVIAQLVNDAYPASHLTTSALRASQNRKIVVWPNLFFSGNCPELLYLSTQSGTRITGPLSVYHNRLVYENWLAGNSADGAVSRIRELYKNESSAIVNTIEKSLDELKDRTADCDVDVYSYIADNWKDRRLFFTFNHPTLELLIQMVRLICEKAEIRIEREMDACFENEPLNAFVPPTFKESASVQEIRYPSVETAKGVVCEVNDTGIHTSGSHYYSIKEFVTTSFKAYEQQNPERENVRYTPFYVHG